MLRGDFRYRLRDDLTLCGSAALLALIASADLEGRGQNLVMLQKKRLYLQKTVSKLSQNQK